MSVSQNALYSSLGLPADSLTDHAKYIHLVREGVPGAVVKRAIDVLGDRDLFVRILNTTSNNLSRYYRRKKMTRADSEELLDTIRLFNQAILVFGNLENAKEWIQTPIPALSGERPVSLLDTFEGRAWVSLTLRKIEFGEFT